MKTGGHHVEHTSISGNPRVHIGDKYNLSTSHDAREEWQKCLRTLYLSDPRAHLSDAIDRTRNGRVENSCEWILDQPSYIEWEKDEDSAMLMLQGAPGMGKTILATYLVDHLAGTQCASNLVYFFCSSTDAKRSTASAVLRGILYHILRELKQRDLQELVLGHFHAIGPQIYEDFFTLWTLFKEITESSSILPLTVLIDGLDECAEDSRERLVRRLVDMMRTRKSTHIAGLKFVILCRPHILDTFGQFGLVDFHSVDISESIIKSDLQNYIDAEVDFISQRKGWSAVLRENIHSALCEKHGGSFLWVSIVMQHLNKAMIPAQARDIVKTFPPALGEVYARILREVPASQTSYAIRALHLVLEAKQPLTRGELALLFALDSQIEPALLPTPDTIEDHIPAIRVCELLLRITGDDERDTVTIRHQSIRDFLTSPELPFDLQHYRFDDSIPNTMLAGLCQTYLHTLEISNVLSDINKSAVSNFTEWQWNRRSTTDFEPGSIWKVLSPSQLALMQYAVFDLAGSDAASQHTFPTRHNVDQRSNNYATHINSCLSCHGSDSVTWRAIMGTGFAAIIADCPAMVGLFSRLPRVDPENHSTFPYRCWLLQYAVRDGSVDTVQVLLDAKAVEASCQQRSSRAEGSWSRIFEAATEALKEGLRPSRADIIVSLLQRARPFNVRVCDVHHPLDLVAKRGQLSAVQICIAAGESVLAKNDEGNIPLHLAADWCQSRLPTIRALLRVDSSKSSLLVRNHKGDIPLHIGIRNSRWALDYGTHQDCDVVCNSLIGRQRATSTLWTRTIRRDLRREDDELPIHLAASRCAGCFTSLARADHQGYTVSARTGPGDTALHRTIGYFGRRELETLMGVGCKPLLWKADASGALPLDVARIEAVRNRKVADEDEYWEPDYDRHGWYMAKAELCDEAAIYFTELMRAEDEERFHRRRSI